MKYTSNFRYLILLSTILIWFLRMVFPGMIFLFVPSFIILLILFINDKTKNFNKSILFEYLKTFNPLLVLGVFFVLGGIISFNFNLKVLRDLGEFFINLILLFILFYDLYQNKQKNGYLRFFRKITRAIGFSAFAVAILGLAKYTLQIYNIQIPIETPFGTAFNDDKNFYALYSFLGIISFYPMLNKPLNKYSRLGFQLIIISLLFNVIFSYSVRSIFLLVLLSVFLIANQLRGWFAKEKFALQLFSKNTRMVTLFLTIFLFLSGYSLVKNREYFFDRFAEEKTISSEGTASQKISNVFHLDKWEYAIDLHKQQPLVKKLFGNGFNYLEEFGEFFHKDANRNDYPHNPILSALLYSGVIGAIFVLFFIAISFYYGIIYFKKYPLFSLMLFVCLSFVFFSGNSIFSVPIFLFLFSLSFLIRHQEISELHIHENINKPGSKVIKETFDYVVAIITLVIFSPILLIISVLIWISMGWPVIFSQKRIGQNGKLFRLHKFRSMKRVASDTTVAARETMRITKLGKFIRKYKLDELPELWNIIRGDMSFVGPRPDVPGYADKLNGDDRIILQLKPGLTGAASLKYMHEEEILVHEDDPQKYNDEVIFPDKVKVNRLYMEKWTLWLDIKLILFTALGKPKKENEMF